MLSSSIDLVEEQYGVVIRLWIHYKKKYISKQAFQTVFNAHRLVIARRNISTLTIIHTIVGSANAESFDLSEKYSKC